ncbi:MAG: phage tail sheath C-terminal domain-containing protein [Pseudomonadota bacterium]
MYKHPGVYIEHVPSSVFAIEAASTSVTAFIGEVGRGTGVTTTSGEPAFITSQTQYAQQFGPLGGGAGGIRDMGQNVDAFGHAVSTFFANGGSKAYIVPVVSATSLGSFSTVDIAVDEGTLTFTATSRGGWAEGLVVRLSQDIERVPDTSAPGDPSNAEPGEYTLTLGTDTGQTEKIIDSTDTEVDATVLNVIETFAGLRLDANSGAFIVNRVTGSSLLVTVSFTAAGSPPATPTATYPVDASMSAATDPGSPGDTDFQAAFDRLRDYRDISIIVLPGLDWATDQGVYERAISHSEFMQNRMVLVDPENPSTLSTQLRTPTNVKSAGFPTSPYSALYYPWLTVSNPYYDPETAANLPKTFAVGPSSMAAGMWGRIDSARGVWKAPAGLEATVRGALGPNVMIGNALQDNLNEWGVNCLRAIIGPTVVWGGRTLATKSQPQYRYIPVRRTQNMIGESLYAALQRVVFEPNDHRLWGGLRASVGNFMDGLYRAGAFQGEKASDAYFVNCGLGSTMTQGDIDAGIVRVVVGFAPLKPAEFVVVQIQQIVGQTA